MSTLLITGTNRGIGLEFVRQYAAAGNTIHATCRNPETAVELREIAGISDGRVIIHTLDMNDFDAIDALGRDLEGVPIDMLINNAGLMIPAKTQRITDMDYDGWAETFKVNTMAPLRMVQNFIENVKASDEKKIINLSSHAASIGDTTHPTMVLAYRTSKTALNRVMTLVALKYAPDGVITTVQLPGWVKTELGGEIADLTPAESVTAMIKINAGLTAQDNGRYIEVDGTTVPW
jgi:NAD(P)-dependent dehydrogenase (short-subunit alcohol dehydrogenase family)